MVRGPLQQGFTSSQICIPEYLNQLVIWTIDHGLRNVLVHEEQE